MQVDAIGVQSIGAAQSTADGQHVLTAFIDAAGRRHFFAFPRMLVVDLMGHLTRAFTQAGDRSGKSGPHNLATVLEAFQVGGSTQQNVITLSLQIAAGAALEFAMTPEQATSLSEALGGAAAHLAGPQSGQKLN